MNINKFFQLAKEQGISECEIVISTNRDLEINIYHKEVESYTVSDTKVINARGIYQGKMGFAISEKDDKTTPYYLVDQIVTAAKVSESDDIAMIFKGSPKYKKRNLYNKELALVSEDTKITNMLYLEQGALLADQRISEVESVSYSENESSFKLYNSHGLKLETKDNLFYYVLSLVAKDGEDLKTGYEIKMDNNPNNIDLDDIIKVAVENTVSKIGAQPCKSGMFKTVINPKVTASLLSAYLSSASAERVQKKSSLFIDKLNTPVASKKITVLDAPLTKNLFYSYFDGEGVAKFNKPVIEKGVLKTYLHNLSTAAKAGVAPTANGTNNGGKIGISISNILLKPGKLSLDELFENVKDGFYLTEVQGLHAGLNPTSGDFSLQASGFMIRDGKLSEPVNLVTIAGNLVKLFKDVTAVGSDSQLQLSSFTTSSIVVKKLAISGH